MTQFSNSTGTNNTQASKVGDSKGDFDCSGALGAFDGYKVARGVGVGIC